MKKRLIEGDLPLAYIRYIEVKARAQSGDIRLSANEWKKARHFGEKFWLNIVTEAGSQQPCLYCILNPAKKFRIDKNIFATGYIISEERWYQGLSEEMDGVQQHDETKN